MLSPLPEANRMMPRHTGTWINFSRLYDETKPGLNEFSCTAELVRTIYPLYSAYNRYSNASL